MLAAVFLLVTLAIVFAFAELVYRVVRLAMRPPRWRALVLLAGAGLCVVGVVHAIQMLL